MHGYIIDDNIFSIEYIYIQYNFHFMVQYNLTKKIVSVLQYLFIYL